MSPDPPPLPRISVIICTRDRPAQLLRCLATLKIASLAVPELPLEVLVVENGSSAACRLAAAKVVAVAPADTQLFRLETGNLSMARNFGMQNARGAILGFVDDDCLVDPRWLADVEARHQSAHVDFLMGGRVKLADPTDIPFTIKDVDHAQTFAPDVHPGGFIQGCNFILPRSTASRIGWFDTRFGAGALFRAGEDTDYIIRAHGLGIPVIYVPDMLVLHHHGRQSLDAVMRLNSAYAHANGAILAKHLFRHPWLAKHMLWTLRSSVREKNGGPGFDDGIGLDWQSVTRDQIAGFAAYVRAFVHRKKTTS